jgi:hypothetical protein
VFAKPACDLDNHLAQLWLALLGDNGRFLHQTALFIRKLYSLEICVQQKFPVPFHS